MNVATNRSEVGIRELKNGLSGYIDRVRDGEEVIVTDRGLTVARLSSLEAAHDRLAELVATVLSSADTALCAAAERRGLHVANPLINRPRPDRASLTFARGVSSLTE